MLPQGDALARRLRQALGAPAPAAADAGALCRRAEALLAKRFGEGEPAASAFAAGYVPLSAEHTHYFDGFGLLLALPEGVAVALRPVPGGLRLACEGLAAREEPVLARLLHALAPRRGLEVAVVATLPLGMEEALVGAAAEAACRALGQASGASPAPGEAACAEAGAAALGRPFGPAYLLAGRSGKALALVDAGTLEHDGMGRERFEEATAEAVGWGLVSTGRAPSEAGFYEARLAALGAALAHLREAGFEGLRSLRGLEHRDLPEALGGLGGLERRVVRHLVGEDRRVPRLYTALARGDGQLAGGLMLMSQASLREDWGLAAAEDDLVVAEAAEADGIYGARAFSGGVLVAGRPFLVAPFLERAAEALAERFGTRPATRVFGGVIPPPPSPAP